MTDAMQELPGLGHNEGPPFDLKPVEDHTVKVNQFAEGAGEWLDLKEIETEEQSEKLTDFISGARKMWNAVDKDRKAAKKPFDDGAAAVQDAYNPLLAILKKTGERSKAMQSAYLKKKAEKLAEEKRIAEQEAEQKRREAAAAARRAEERNDVAGQVEAEAMAKAAEKATKKAARPVKAQAKSATGSGTAVGLRTIREPVISNLGQAFLHFKNEPGIAGVILRLAAAEIRASKGADIEIPGIDIVERKAVA